MEIKAVLFDLDGTLLPMDEEIFVKGYFKLLASKVAELGYKPDELIAGVVAGLKHMASHDGSKRNIDVFWESFAGIFGNKVYDDKPFFDQFYANDFKQIAQFCGYNPLAKQAVDYVRNKGLKVVLATNPVFPSVATETRIALAGLTNGDFDHYTTYENSSACKPNLSYYSEILENIQCRPEECLMVGNNVSEDMVAAELGMNVFLVTDCLINKKDQDISNYPQGDFQALLAYLKLKLEG